MIIYQKLSMYPYLFKSDSITIGSYGFFLAIAYLFGRWYFLKTIEKNSANTNNMEILIILLLVLGVIGAKAMFLFKNPEKSSLLLSGTGFSSQGALLGALLATFLFSYFNKIKLSTILDCAAPAAILAYGLARIGCFMSGDDCHGLPTELPWGMSFPDGIEKTLEKVHPVPLYEIFYSSMIFMILVSRQKVETKAFSQFFLLLGLWGVSRFTVEFVSSNPKIILSMSGSQFGALLMALASTVYFVIFNQSNSINKES